MTNELEKRGGAAWLLAGLFTGAIGYVPSSGPVLAAAFWLRESTGWDGFYAVMLIYLPLLALGHDNAIGAYIDWWVKLLGTVGPG
jgi:hypothetical protein